MIIPIEIIYLESNKILATFKKEFSIDNNTQRIHKALTFGRSSKATNACIVTLNSMIGVLFCKGRGNYLSLKKIFANIHHKKT